MITFFFVHGIFRVWIFFCCTEILNFLQGRFVGQKYKKSINFIKKVKINRLKMKWKGLQKKPQQIIVITFIIKMRRQIMKSCEKFLRNCIAKVARIENLKCTGKRLEVSGSLSAYGAGWGFWRGGKGEWRDTAMYIGVSSVVVEAFENSFQDFSNFRISDQISACSPLNPDIIQRNISNEN